MKKINKFVLILSYVALFVLLAYFVNQNRVLTSKVNDMTTQINYFEKKDRFVSKLEGYKSNVISSLSNMNKILREGRWEIDPSKEEDFQQSESRYIENLKNIINLEDELRALINSEKTIITPTITGNDEFEMCKEKLNNCNYSIKTYCQNDVDKSPTFQLNTNEGITQCLEKIQSCMNYIPIYCKNAPRIE